jgi:hypothetical protein
VRGGQRAAREGALEDATEDVLAVIEPPAWVELPALTGARRDDPDAVAEQYGSTYEVLLAVAVE